MRVLGCALACIIGMVFTAQARVLSYAPYSDRASIPAIQSRLNRHFVLAEQAPAPAFGTTAPTGPLGPAQVVLYDSKGLEEPLVIYPQDGSYAPVINAISQEDDREIPTILIETIVAGQPAWRLTNDGGKTWINVALPAVNLFPSNGVDTGGPFVRARYSPLLVGTREMPFFVAMNANGNVTVYGVTFDGTVKQLVSVPVSTVSSIALLGRDATGSRLLVQGGNGVWIVDLDGKATLAAPNAFRGLSYGWITPVGSAYVEQTTSFGNVVLLYTQNGTVTPVAASWDGAPDVTPTINASWVFYALPTADYGGAWMIRRGGSRPTTFLLHTPAAGVQTQWQDVSAPEVEALHPAPSGKKVLIQVHRPRQTIDNLLFKDPALAVWHAGDGAPKAYDELFLSETLSKGFVHLDADKVESGEPFVFDSGVPSSLGFGSPVSAGGGGGGDVVQEWGVVRASLQQKLVLPAVGRITGAFGSKWATDLTLYNPGANQITVTLTFAPSGTTSPRMAPVALNPRQIRLITDVIDTLFGADNTTGALFVTPPAGISMNVTARTYTTRAQGTYGFTKNGVDFLNAAGPRFPLTFSGVFQGASYRTNLTIADVSGRGTTVNASGAGPYGQMTTTGMLFNAVPNGQQQFNFLGLTLGVGNDTGALILQPSRGEAIASVFVVDNRTNDPTFFPPDIPASVVRVIPAIGHLDGANGSKFRSDLFLYNNSPVAKLVTLQAKSWDVPESPAFLPLTLLPYEARVIRDVLLTAFGKTGIARLRFVAQGSATDASVRVTSRTYTVNSDGGTYGFLMPPLNSFQSAAAGDTLEILGAALDPQFRTNLGLVELSAFPNQTAARARVEIIDDAGASLDSFEVAVPSAGGMQINDLFHARGLPDSGKPVLIRVTTIQGSIGAYGAFVDNRTNDPAYVAANLAARN